MPGIALLVLSGIWTGGIATIAWERIPIWRRMTPLERAVDFRRTLYRMDPTMPILAVAIVVLGIASALQHDGAARTLTWAAIGCVLLIVIGTTAILEPMNSKFRRLPEGTPPDNADAILATWGKLHIARTAVAVVSLILFVTAQLS